MQNINFYNLSDINCWIVYQMPFEKDEKSNQKVLSHQEFCIKNNIFAMGWRLNKNFFNKNFGEMLEYADCDEDNYKGYLGAYKIAKGNTSPKKALEDYKRINQGDYVVMRARNAHYYIGKVKKKAQYLHKDDESEYKHLSWGCHVEKWLEFKTQDDLPYELIGRMSQQQHQTIQRIDRYRLKFLIIEAYIKREKSKSDIPKLIFTKNNFARSLHYKQLEDLVSLYIVEKNKEQNYLLMPSSCKINEQKYEFFFKSPNRKAITCQVKNQEEIKIEEYYNENDFEKIYIFSGIWDNEQVKELNKKARKNRANNIQIISPDELFDILQNSKYNYKEYLNLNSYYKIDENKAEDLHLTNGFIKCKKFNSKCHMRYKEDNDYITFYNNCLFYSKEFNSFFLYDHFANDLKIIKEIFDKIKETNPEINIKEEKL